MMAMTTSSSISVKPDRERFLHGITPHDVMTRETTTQLHGSRTRGAPRTSSMAPLPHSTRRDPRSAAPFLVSAWCCFIVPRMPSMNALSSGVSRT